MCGWKITFLMETTLYRQQMVSHYLDGGGGKVGESLFEICEIVCVVLQQETEIRRKPNIRAKKYILRILVHIIF